MMKVAMKETLGRAHESLEVLQTIVIGVELILNDQPLTYFSDNICDPEHLTIAFAAWERIGQFTS